MDSYDSTYNTSHPQRAITPLHQEVKVFSFQCSVFSDLPPRERKARRCSPVSPCAKMPQQRDVGQAAAGGRAFMFRGQVVGSTRTQRKRKKAKRKACQRAQRRNRV